MPMPDINQYLKHYSGNVSDQIAAARPYGQACWDERGKEEAAKNCGNCGVADRCALVDHIWKAVKENLGERHVGILGVKCNAWKAK